MVLLRISAESLPLGVANFFLVAIQCEPLLEGLKEGNVDQTQNGKYFWHARCAQKWVSFVEIAVFGMKGTPRHTLEVLDVISKKS